MKVYDQVETQLNDVFGKKAPKLPAKATKTIVEWAPWVSLAIGALSLWGAYMLWHWAHIASAFIDYTNNLCMGVNLYASSPDTCASPATNYMTFWVWLGLAVLAVEGVLYLLAFPGLRDHKKAGWNFLYWGALVNLVYAIVSLFTGYNSAMSFVGALIGSAVGLWLLFQVRGSYSAK